MSRAVRRGPALVALLLAAACGTTVPNAGRGTGTLDVGALAGSGSQQALSGASAAAHGSAGSTSTGAVAVPGSATAAPVAAAGTGSSAVGSLAANKPITIGVITSGNVGGFGQSLGLQLNYGDQRAQAKVLADYLNKRGGIAGHQIKLTYYDYDAAGGGPGNAQAACAAFTEDTHAFAAIGIAAMDDAFHACAAKHGMIVASDADEKAASFFKRFPTTIEISDVELGRKYRAMVHGLSDMGFFTKGAKVGVVYLDEPNDVEAVRGSLKPTLAEIGFAAADEVALNQNDSSQQLAEQQSAILRFSTEGITHVVFARATAWEFAQAAEKQGYYPKYGIDSRQSPGLLMQTVNSPQTLVNVMGIGYQPVQDVDQARDPGPVSARQKLCTKLYDDAGQSSSSTRLALAAGLYLCDQLFFLHDAFAGAPDVSLPSFLRGVAGLASRYESPLTFATRFSATQHDGSQGYRPLRYTTDCGCFHYVGPVRLFR